MDPTSAAIEAFLTALGDALPADVRPYLKLVALVILGCKLVMVLWQPPAATSRWVPVYRVISTLGLCVGWAVNAFQPGKRPILVPLVPGRDDRGQIAATLGVSRDATKP